jgi:Flp pilus assembly protein TadD
MDEMKNRRAPIGRLLLGSVCCVLAAGTGCNRNPETSAAPTTPPPAAASSEIFQRVLQEARKKTDQNRNDSEALRRLARLLQANGRDDEALDCYGRLSAIPPGLAARDHYYVALIRLDQSDLAGAEMELSKVLKTEPGYLPAHLKRGEALFKLGREAEAAKEYAAALVIEPDNPPATLGLARLDLQRSDDAAAISRLEKLLATHPESTSGAALLAQVLARRGDAVRAAALQQWSRQKPEPISPDPWMTALNTDVYDRQRLGLLFEDYFKTGQIAEALPFMQRFEELDPQSPIPPTLKGWAAAQAHRDDEAVRQYQLALEKGGSPEKICPYFAQSLLAQGKISDAAALLEKYYTKMPESLPIAIAYSDVAVRQGDARRARELLEKILARDPSLYAQNMNLAKLLWTSGERDAAAVCLQRVANVYARDVPSRALLGEYYLAKSDLPAAIKVLEAAKPSATESTAAAGISALLDRAYLLAAEHAAKLDQWAESAMYSDKAVAIAPMDPEGYAGKAAACVQLKRFADAITTLNKLSELQPENPTVYVSLGDIFQQIGDSANARREWEKAQPCIAAGDVELRAAVKQRLSGRFNAETAR